MPGMEGGIVGRRGSDQFRIKLQGFAESGDAAKPQLLSMLNTSQALNIPSTLAGTSFFSGQVYIEKFIIGPSAGRGYPYYNWVVNTIASGQFNVQVLPPFPGPASVFASGVLPVLYGRATFATSGFYYVFLMTGSQLFYCSTSSTGALLTFSAPTFVTSGLRGRYNIWYDGTHVHYAVSRAAVRYRRGTPTASGTVTWDAAEQVANSSGYSPISVAVDSIGHPWIFAYDFIGQSVLTTSSTTDGTWATQSGWPLTIAGNTVGVLAPGVSGAMTILFSVMSTVPNNLQIQVRSGTGANGAFNYVTESPNNDPVYQNSFSIVAQPSLTFKDHFWILRSHRDLTSVSGMFMDEGVSSGVITSGNVVLPTVSGLFNPQLSIGSNNNLMGFWAYGLSGTAYANFDIPSATWDSSPTLVPIVSGNIFNGNFQANTNGPNAFYASSGIIGVVYTTSGGAGLEQPVCFTAIAA